MEPFKNLLGPAQVKQAATALRGAWPGFNAAAFERAALRGLDALEFKGRAGHIASALQAHLPADFAQAAGVIEAALAPPVPVDSPTTAPPAAGLAGWIVWPLGEYVARQGLATPERALACLHALTQRLTAEWALRPFLQHHPEITFKTLQRWAGDPSAHVRRLASEGSRPRLPWGQQLKALVADPRPTLPLLLRLQDDPSPYVRRSVANHLNDIAKDHPGVVAAWVAEHLPGASAERRALLRHACRTLIKQGHAPTLALWGLGQAFKGQATLAVAPRAVVLGGAVRLAVVLQASGRKAQALEVDYLVHHVKADGSTSAKVFKGWRLTLAGGERRELGKQHAVKPITTRRYHAGRHRVELQVNGQVVAEAAFVLRLD